MSIRQLSLVYAIGRGCDHSLYVGLVQDGSACCGPQRGYGLLPVSAMQESTVEGRFDVGANAKADVWRRSRARERLQDRLNLRRVSAI